MTAPVNDPEQREHLCRILHDANTGKICPDPSDPTRYGAMADAVLDSDWLAAVERQVRDKIAAEIKQEQASAAEASTQDIAFGFMCGIQAAARIARDGVS